MPEGQQQLLAWTIVGLVVLWTYFWKCIAFWVAARRGQLGWYVVLLWRWSMWSWWRRGARRAGSARARGERDAVGSSAGATGKEPRGCGSSVWW
jgi:hypothetical protein